MKSQGNLELNLKQYKSINLKFWNTNSFIFKFNGNMYKYIILFITKKQDNLKQNKD